MSKKDIVPFLCSDRLNKELQQLCPQERGCVRPHARHLGARYSMRGHNAAEVDNRIRAIHRGWALLGRFWSEHGLKRLKREVYLGVVVGGGLTGIEAYVLRVTEYKRIDSAVAKYLRVLMRGSATSWTGPHVKTMSNLELLREWKILPARGELAIRRIRWLQQMLRHRFANQQTLTALFGHLGGERPTLDLEGHLRPDANPWVLQLAANLEMYRGLSGTESFFEQWQDMNDSWFSIFEENSEPAHEFLRIDPSLLRAAAFTSKLTWARLFRPDILYDEGDHEDKFVCGWVLEGGGTCTCTFKTYAQLLGHRTHGHGERAVSATIVTNQCPNCSSTFTSVDIARSHI
eukprot:9466289-Pyramimonas_sp.AAC.1